MKTIGVLGTLCAVVLWPFRLRFPFDDVFITFRYAEHVASGYGLVWNIGGIHTEGYTNFLFILLLAVARFFTSDLLAFAQAIGLLSTIATAIVLYAIALRLNASEPRMGRQAGFLAAVLYCVTPLTWINALSGMETSFFVLLCALGIYFATEERLSTAFLVTFLATLTRPEGALLAFIILVAVRTKTAEVWPAIRSFVICFAIPLALYAVWKYFYFGTVLPNSFYVKVLSGSHARLPGLQYVRLFFASALVVILLPFCIRSWRGSFIVLPIAWAGGLLVFYLFVLPLEGLYDRFLWPAFAALTVPAAVGAVNFIHRRTWRPFWIPASIIFLVQVLYSFLTPRTKQALAAHEDLWDVNMDRVVQELNMLPHRDSVRFAYGDAGYVVYKTGIYHIDLFGLNDTRIAHAHSTGERAAIVAEERPDLLLLPIYGVRRTGPDGIRIRDTCAEWIEDAYGLARSKQFEPVATIDAFPYTLAFVVNVNSTYYWELKNYLERRLNNPSGNLRPIPNFCYFTR